MEIVSTYIDHNFIDEKIIGEYFQDNTYEESNLEEQVCVSTCHRFEYYCVDNFKTFSITDVDCRYTKNSLKTAQRLIELLTGTQSIILAEPHIRNQFVKAFALTKNINLIKFFNKCLEISDQIRTKYNFFNHKNYVEIAMDIISKDQLLVIGGGMLAQNILNYDKQFQVITRNPKKFKKQTKNNNALITKLDQNKKPFKQCIIATVIKDNNYSDQISNFLNEYQIDCVIDLSSVPLYQQKPQFEYITMYDELFKKQIQSSNKSLLPLVDDVKKTIQQTVINQYRDLI